MMNPQRFIVRNWFWIAFGCVLQKKAIEIAYLERGFKSIGGEWFVLPIILMAVTIARGIIRSITDVMKAEEAENDTAVVENRRRVSRQRSSNHRPGSGKCV